MGVSAQITQHVFRSTERRFGVDDPVVAEQEAEPAGEGPWFGKWCQLTAEVELAFAESRLECGDELTAEDTAENFYWQEERIARGDPARMIGARPPAATTQ
jgi:hypothetical protein